MPSDKPDKPSETVPEVALALARELAEQDDAQLVDHGNFSLDLARARDKLAHKRLVNPGLLILMLVEVGNLLEGCTAIRLRSRPHELSADFAGVRLRTAELSAGLKLELGELDELEPEARANALGRRTLAVAIDAALALAWTKHVDIVSMTHEGTVASVRMRSGQAPQPNPEAGVVHAKGLSLRIHRAWSAGGRQGKVERELIDRARYSTVPVSLDERRIDTPTPLADLDAPTAIRSPEGATLGTIGWSQARERSTIQLLANGVVLESLVQPDWPPGGTAVVEASDLRRDLSLTKFIRDEAFEARIALVQAQASAITPAGETFIEQAPDGSSQLAGDNTRVLALYGVVAMAAVAYGYVLIPAALIMFIVLALAGAAAIVVGAKSVRAIMVQGRGLRGVARVKAVEAGDQGHQVLRVDVALPDRDPYPGTIHARLDDSSLKRITPDTRVRVCVDPEDHQRIVFASSHV